MFCVLFVSCVASIYDPQVDDNAKLVAECAYKKIYQVTCSDGEIRAFMDLLIFSGYEDIRISSKINGETGKVEWVVLIRIPNDK